MYSLTQEVSKGANIVAALQDYPNMPSIAAVCRELDYLNDYIADSERFYGVAFRRYSGKGDDTQRPRDQFDVVTDTKSHFEEFYFGGNQELEFGFRPRAYYRLVVEPLLDSMATLSHDDVLDSMPNVIEQIKERVVMAAYLGGLDSATAYKQYKQAVSERQSALKIKEITKGVMKLRRKTLALQREINKQK